MATRHEPADLNGLLSNDRRDVLLALQTRLAQAINFAAPNELSPLVKQMADVTRELDAMPKAEASQVDEIAAAAERRRARAAAEAMEAQ